MSRWLSEAASVLFQQDNRGRSLCRYGHMGDPAITLGDAGYWDIQKEVKKEG